METTPLTLAVHDLDATLARGWTRPTGYCQSAESACRGAALAGLSAADLETRMVQARHERGGGGFEVLAVRWLSEVYDIARINTLTNSDEFFRRVFAYDREHPGVMALADAASVQALYNLIDAADLWPPDPPPTADPDAP